MAPTADGYIAVGESNSSDSYWVNRGRRNAIIVKYDLNGNVIWAKSAGGTHTTHFNSVAVAADGYVAVGISMSTDAPWGNYGAADAIIVKYDFDGNIVWAVNTGGTDSEEYTSVAAAPDGYVAVGFSYSKDAPWGSNDGIDAVAIIVKYDRQGHMVWSKHAGGTGGDFFRSVAITGDGGYIAVGDSDSADAVWGNNGDADAIIVKYDSHGNIVWAKNIGGPARDLFKSVATVSDGYIAAGMSYGSSKYWGNNGDFDAIIVKYNLHGDVMWARNTGGADYDCFDSVMAAAGGYIAVGNSSSTNAQWGNKGDYDAIIVKYNRNGNIVWANNIGGKGFDLLSSIAAASNGYVSTGMSDSTDAPWGNNGQHDAIILKFSETQNNNALLKILLFILAARIIC